MGGARTPSSRATEAIGRDTPRGTDPISMLIGFRRALTVSCAMWPSWVFIDLAVVNQVKGARFVDFLLVRAAVWAVMLLVRLRVGRKPTLTERGLTVADLVLCCAASVGIALLSLEFRGLASPYVPGVCLVLLSRTVTLQYSWKRGVVMTGIPMVAFFVVLFGAALFSPLLAAQFHDADAMTTLLLNVAYVFGTYVFLVIGGHVVWSLRRQVFEARNLGRYRLKRRLGAGGMGDVWMAYHPGLKRDVAVKILRPEAQERSASALTRFEREVHATAQLMHPNTVRVFDYGTTEDSVWYYVMELLEGETLAEHVSLHGPLAPARAVHIVGQAARALGEAHEHGIVHRDIKPENLFLTSLGGEHDFVKVIDFGIAKVRSSDSHMTETGSVLGTPAYISPEVAVGNVADARSDVYGLGAVLYFLLTGRPPFEAETPGALIFAHVHERVVSPSAVTGRALPHDLEAIVLCALEKDPEQRFETAADLALALASCSSAGKWTFGDAYVARRSSRPPPSGIIETQALPPLDAPAVPREWADSPSDVPSLNDLLKRLSS